MNKEIVNARKQNMKIYSLYRTISLDLIFYYAIEFLFLTQVKGITPSQTVLSTSFYAIFMIILQIPASVIIDKLGTKKCTVFANVFNTLFIILIMTCGNMYQLIFAQFISALCFSLKDISDGALLNYSIPETKKKGDIFSRIEGKGFQNYFFVNSITAVISGFLYVINPYIPITLTLIFTIFSVILSLGFKDIEKTKKQQKKEENKVKRHYIKELQEGMKFIIKSQRLRSLFIYAGVSWGVFCLLSTYRSSVLVDIGTPTQIITAIAAIVGIASSLGSKNQLYFNRKFKNKSLTIILISTIVSTLIGGIIVLLKIPYLITLIVLTITFIIINLDKGMSLVLVSRYLGNFSSEKILTQIYAANAMVKNLLRAIIGFLGSYLLDITNTANSMVIVGLFLLVVSISLIGYMKTRLGLKPEEYGEDEIYNKDEVYKEKTKV